MGLNEARVIQKVVTHPIGGSADRIVRVPKGTRGHVAGYQKTEYWILILLWHQNLLFPSGTRRILSGLSTYRHLRVGARHAVPLQKFWKFVMKEAQTMTIISQFDIL